MCLGISHLGQPCKGEIDQLGIVHEIPNREKLYA
jgi:hypothetical protein